MRRLLLFAVLMAGSLRSEAPPVPGVREKLRARILETLPPAPVIQPREEGSERDGEPVLELEPMIITSALDSDLLAEARRAAATRQAEEFSVLRGGRLLSFRKGEIGFWPKIVPTNATPVKKGDVAITIDLLRINW
jgi:hypothetical protein